MALGFTAIVLFALLMFTRRRLDAVEARASTLLDSVQRLQRQAEEHQTRVARLEQRLVELAAGGVVGVVDVPGSSSDAATFLPPAAVLRRPEPALGAAPASIPEPTPSPSAFARAPAPADVLQPQAATGPAPADVSRANSAPTPVAPAAPDAFDSALGGLRELLFGGNTVVRAGILILLVGVVLLLRWASEHALLPIELRLSGAALLAIGLVAFGYRQRALRPGFSRALQGGGVAALYLVVFFAFRSYDLLPPPLAFGLLVGIALGGGALAVLQDSRSLILIAQLFGFAAPLLASTGQGSHVALFSYYLVLNLVVAGIAWFKAWRALNLLGFACTFGVASAWGVLRYEPQHFASTEPFLIAFFLLYVALPVLFALRHPGTPRGWVDGSLVFGTPLAALGLQWSLVHDRPFAMAYTALGMAAVYLVLTWLLKRRAPERLAALGEAFLPIGVGFATLAIPYGFDNHNLTGATWALEGAGLYWVGVRQSRWLSRTAGVALQFLAGAAIATDAVRPLHSLPLLNTWFLAGMLLGLASLFIAYYSHAQRERVRREWRLVQALIGWALCFLLGFGLSEVDAWVSAELEPGAEIAWIGALALALELAAGKLGWQPARYPGLLLWVAMAGLLARHHYDYDTHPLARGGFFGWPVLAIAMLAILRRFVPQAPAFVRFAHPIALWLWTGWLVSLVQHGVADLVELDASYVVAASLTTATLTVLTLLALSRGASWPIGAERRLYLAYGAGGVVLALMLYMLGANLTQSGSNAPIRYLPALNALDIALLLACVAILLWIRRGEEAFVSGDLHVPATVALALSVFVWWNGLLARTVHHYAGVPFRVSALWDSVELQVAVSISWTMIALGSMVVAHRRRARPAWWTGAALLTVVVAKLFLLDLAELSAPAKIGTFLGVGLLLLVVGALAPVPPMAAEARPETPA